MNDRYLYRAKRTDNGEWVEGCLLIIDDSEYRIATSCLQGDVKELLNVCAYEVDQSTICQCTGHKDKNSNLIWENDVCKYYNPEDKDGIAIIKEDYASWISGTIRQTEIMTPMFYLKCCEEWEVIGNIFDNPELLEK